MIDETLRRCPFCGGRAKIGMTNHDVVFIYCENFSSDDINDNIHIVEVSAKTEKEARELWEGKCVISGLDPEKKETN